jgi:hypothetical protein
MINLRLDVTQGQAFGATVSTGSGLYSFFGTTLPIVQWFAAVLGATAAILTLISVIRHWNDKR